MDSPSVLDGLLHPAGRPSWEAPELTSLNRLAPHATLERARSTVRSLDGEWLLKVTERPGAAPAALASLHGFETVEVPGLWTMQGLGSPHYTNVVMPFDTRPPRVPEENPTGVYRREFTVPHAWRAAPDGAALRWRGGGAARAAERPAGRHRQGCPHPGGVRRDRARTPRRHERGRRGRRSLVRCQLRRGSGSVVARRNLARRPTALDSADVRRGRVRARWARRRLPPRAALAGGRGRRSVRGLGDRRAPPRSRWPDDHRGAARADGRADGEPGAGRPLGAGNGRPRIRRSTPSRSPCAAARAARTSAATSGSGASSCGRAACS